MPRKSRKAAPAQGAARRPAVIILCSLIWMLNPLANIAWRWLTSGLDPLAFYERYRDLALAIDVRTIADLAVWAFAFPVAFGIWRVRAWGWILFLLHALAVGAHSLLGPDFRPLLATQAFFNLPFTAVALYYLFSSTRKPYFNPRLRWWDRDPRYRDAIHLFIEGKEYKLFDISLHGIFIADPEATTRSPGRHLAADISLGGEGVTLSMEIVRIHPGGGAYPTGFGARFFGLDARGKDFLARYVSELRQTSAVTVGPEFGV